MTTRKSTLERRDEIVLAALGIIANDGLGKFTTASIARTVGISEGALFRHFTSKDEILRELVAHIERTVMETTANAKDAPLPALKRLFLQRADLLRRNPDLVKILFSHQLEQALGPEHHQQILRIKQLSGRFIREKLMEAAALHQLRTDLPPRVLQMFFMGMLHVLVMQEPQIQISSPPEAPPEPELIWLSIEKFLKGE